MITASACYCRLQQKPLAAVIPTNMNEHDKPLQTHTERHQGATSLNTDSVRALCLPFKFMMQSTPAFMTRTRACNIQIDGGPFDPSTTGCVTHASARGRLRRGAIDNQSIRSAGERRKAPAGT